jgi:hypothetical protein
MNRLPEKAFMFHQPAIAFFGNGATKGCAETHMGRLFGRNRTQTCGLAALGRPILPKEDEGDRDNFWSIRNPIRYTFYFALLYASIRSGR